MPSRRSSAIAFSEARGAVSSCVYEMVSVAKKLPSAVPSELS